VTELLYRYANALDRRAYEELREVFTADATVDFGELGGTRSGHDAIVRFCSRALEPFAAVQHFITNVVTAGETSSCYFFAVHIQEGKEPFLVGGTYEDRFTQTADGWRIAERKLVALWQR
jgi:3-phenylpropionate/cinnamic acid dioxygenase small subunit